MRNQQEIENKISELFDRMWLSRHAYFVKKGIVTKEKHPDAFKAEEETIKKLGMKKYTGETDVEWGEIIGARRALEWVISQQKWDDICLDT